MNVATATLPAFARPGQAAGPTCALTRPATEWWEVGDKRYDSTADLVSQLQVGNEGAEAVYHYKTTEESQKPLSSYVRDYAVQGAIGGAVLGVIGVVGINVLGVIGSIMTAGFYGMWSGVGLVAPVAVCTAGGALIGALSAKEGYNDFQRDGNMVYGTVMSNNGQLGFHVNNQLQNRVDLASYATAPVEADTPNCTPWWQQNQGL